MANAQIVLARVDDRLIHAQVATQWVSATNASLIFVANDEVAGSKMRQSLMDEAAPEDVKTRYAAVSATANALSELEDERVLLLVESPEDALALVEKGVELGELNIGNMATAVGKRQVNITVAVSDEDVAAFKKLADKGVKLTLQRLPSLPPEDVDKIFA